MLNTKLCLLPSGSISERYAFIWKSSKVKLEGRPRLLSEVEDDVWREPYYARFIAYGKTYDVITLHARQNRENSVREINVLLQQLLSQSDVKNWVLMGDFNITEQEDVWNQIYNVGYEPAVRNSPTTLKRSCADAVYVNFATDNIYYDSKRYVASEAKVVDFVIECSRLQASRKLSDHLPVGVLID